MNTKWIESIIIVGAIGVMLLADSIIRSLGGRVYWGIAACGLYLVHVWFGDHKE